MKETEINSKEKGFITAIATSFLVVIVALVSSVSLISIVQTDHQKVMMHHDMIQEELLLRSDAVRTNLIYAKNANAFPPNRIVEIVEPERISTYTLFVKSFPKIIYNALGFVGQSAISVQTLVTAKRATKFGVGENSKIKRLTERLISNKSLAEFQYFTQYETSENSDDPSNPDYVRFYGADELFGPVHSNDDIVIRNIGGWPTFHEMVTTAGRILDFNTMQPAIQSAPMDEIFLGGFQEEVPGILFNPDAALLRANGARPFDVNADIVAVKINGGAFESRIGYVQTHVDTFTVYDRYPDPAHPTVPVLPENILGVNTVTLKDTTWSTGPTGSITNGSVFVECELWIEGCIAGKQTWGSADTIFITNDIYYNGTSIGQPPDNTPGANQTDYFGLVSEERIYIRYKNRDPFLAAGNEPGPIVSPNCSDIILYGAYAAIGDGNIEVYGDYNSHYDGIFSFEYQHPHGSTPGFVRNGVAYDFIDFHKYFYPLHPVNPNNPFGWHGGPPAGGWPTCGYPYEPNSYYNSSAPPYGTDWPFYNPVWPESQQTIVFLRGDIVIFGAIAQTRRGFVRRSGSDPKNHPDNPTAPDFYNINAWDYSGIHGPTGYDKDYHYDERLRYVQPPDFPQVYEGFGGDYLSSFEEDGWYFLNPDAF